MVTHTWENLFRDLCAAVIADALEENTFDLKLDLMAWQFSMGAFIQYIGPVQSTFSFL